MRQSENMVGMIRALTEDQQRIVDGAIVEHLEQSNWKIEPSK